jgi:predicted membrane protein|tara:strand:+ start:305 stop:703 length:399 start_codon:yes stop_codon:yes gene_type:complete
MKLSEIELPSNKKFGYFFTLIFTSVSIYFFINSMLSWAILFAFIGVIFFITTFVKASLLLPLNKLWMRFGLLLGQIISPLVLGIIFFGIFTPVAFLMRLSGRDELRLKFKNKTSYWILRNEPIQGDSFRRQF